MESTATMKTRPMSTRLKDAVRTARNMSPEERVGVLVRAGMIHKRDATKAIKKMSKRHR
jgi:hypothetical protein